MKNYGFNFITPFTGNNVSVIPFDVSNSPFQVLCYFSVFSYVYGAGDYFTVDTFCNIDDATYTTPLGNVLDIDTVNVVGATIVDNLGSPFCTSKIPFVGKWPIPILDKLRIIVTTSIPINETVPAAYSQSTFIMLSIDDSVPDL